MKYKYKRRFLYSLIFILISLIVATFFLPDPRPSAAIPGSPIVAVIVVSTSTPAKIEPKKSSITGYSAIESCFYKNCLMASGNPAYVGAVACPRSIHLGARVKIFGKTYTCEDRTALYLDGRFDIFFGYSTTSQKEAMKFGLRRAIVEIL